jgi:hypothetical protein
VTTKSDDAPDQYEPMKISLPQRSMRHCSEGSRLHSWRRIPRCSTVKHTHGSANSQKAHDGVGGTSTKTVFHATVATKKNDAPYQYEHMKFSLPQRRMRHFHEGSRLYSRRRIPRRSTLNHSTANSTANSQKAHDSVGLNSTRNYFSCHSGNQK